MSKDPRQSKKRQPCLIIPIETKARELHAKFYLGCVAAERGFRVIIGGARALRDSVCWLPRGAFFLDKSVAPSRAEWFAGCRKLGLRVAAWCEEGLAFSDDQEYLRRKVDRDALSQVECFFAWGAYQTGLVRRHAPESAAHVLSVGNPRIDILHSSLRQIFQPEVERIKSDYPRMILVNSNFSLCNHKKGKDGFLNDLRANAKVKTPEDEQFALAWVAHKQVLFDAFRLAIFELSESFPDNTIVLRPHPSENHETWRRLLAPLPNVKVLFDGSVIPWLMAADVVVHNGCTTGLEGVLLERPVLAYQPVTSSEYDTELPNLVSERIHDLPALVSTVRGILGGQHRSLNQPLNELRALNSYLEDIQGGATDRIVQNLCRCYVEKDKPGLLTDIVCELRRRYWQFQFSRRPKRKIDPHVIQKFPGLSHAEMLALLGTFQQVAGRFHGVTVEGFMGEHFTLQSDSRRTRGPFELCKESSAVR